MAAQAPRGAHPVPQLRAAQRKAVIQAHPRVAAQREPSDVDRQVHPLADPQVMADELVLVPEAEPQVHLLAQRVLPPEEPRASPRGAELVPWEPQAQPLVLQIQGPLELQPVLPEPQAARRAQEVRGEPL